MQIGKLALAIRWKGGKCLRGERSQSWGPPAGKLRVTLCPVVSLLDTQLGEEAGGYFQLSMGYLPSLFSQSL